MALALPWPYVGGLWDRPKDLNDLADKVQQNFDALGQQFPVGGGNMQTVPQARVYNSGAQTVNNVTATALTFDTERYDSGTSTEQHSTSSNTSRLTCRVAGLYAIGGCLHFEEDATGERFASVRVNGSTEIAQAQVKASTTAGFGTQVTVNTQYRLAVGDYAELVASQNSGGALDTAVHGNYSPEFYWHWVSP